MSVSYIYKHHLLVKAEKKKKFENPQLSIQSPSKSEPSSLSFLHCPC